MDNLISAITPSIMIISLAMPMLFGLYMHRTGKLDIRRTCMLILICGMILRLIYITYTNQFIRQHDLGSFYGENDCHAGYITYILEHHKLPDVDPRDHSQFYHPPFYHILCAVVLGILDLLGFDYRTTGPGVLQMLTVCYSSLFCVLAYKTFKLFGIKDKALALATAAVTFHPTLIILSGSLNNDMLSSLFSMAAIYFTARWVKDTHIHDIIFIGLCIGFGMMTKLTVGLLAPAVAAVFLTVLIKQAKNWKKLVPQYFAFAAVCLPTGLFWSIRNYVKFGMAPNYVWELSENSGQYIDVPPFKRLVDYSLYQFSSPFTQWEWNGDPYNEFNPVIALMKNAMFDEETFFHNSITLQSFCTALFFAGAVTAVISVIAIVLMLLKREKLCLEYKLLISLVFGVIFVNYIVFCINYPQVCTENMRYCVPLIFAGSAAIGLMLDRYKKTKNTAMKIALKTARVSIPAMCALSIFVYTAMLF